LITHEVITFKSACSVETGNLFTIYCSLPRAALGVEILVWYALEGKRAHRKQAAILLFYLLGDLEYVWGKLSIKSLRSLWWLVYDSQARTDR